MNPVGRTDLILLPRKDPEMLPREISIQVFSFLKPIDLAFCCRVNHKWKKLASDHDLWKILLPSSTLLRRTNFHRLVERYGIRSKQVLLQHIEAFAERAPRDRSVHFLCEMPMNKDCYILLELAKCNASPPNPYIKYTQRGILLEQLADPLPLERVRGRYLVSNNPRPLKITFSLPKAEKKNFKLLKKIKSIFKKHEIKRMEQERERESTSRKIQLATALGMLFLFIGGMALQESRKNRQ